MNRLPVTQYLVQTGTSARPQGKSETKHGRRIETKSKLYTLLQIRSKYLTLTALNKFILIAINEPHGDHPSSHEKLNREYLHKPTEQAQTLRLPNRFYKNLEAKCFSTKYRPQDQERYQKRVNRLLLTICCTLWNTLDARGHPSSHP